MTEHVYRPDQKHPEPYQQDLNPEALKGVNWGLAGPHPEKPTWRSAYEQKDVHRQLRDFSDDELKQIPLLPLGSRLESDAIYLNLHQAERRPFKAKGTEEVGEGDWIVPKSEVAYQLWNRLIGVSDPDRTGGAPRPR